VKHGALSDQKGHVDIAWQLMGGDDQGRFVMNWNESGGPSIRVPKRRGFGSKVIKNMIELSLEGNVKLKYAPAGFSWELVCPARKIRDSEISGGIGDDGKARQ
jgi:two-component sensor histidine kinase